MNPDPPRQWYTHLGNALQVTGLSIAAIAPTDLLWIRAGLVMVAIGKGIAAIWPEPK